MPMLFTGLRVALSTSWATLVAAEMLAAQKGLGYMIQTNRMLANADNILVVNQGDVVEQGTHEELMQGRGFYYRLYRAQFE